MSFAVAQWGALELAAKEFNERVYAGAKRPLDHRSVDASAGTKAVRLARMGRWTVGLWTPRLALQDKITILLAPPPPHPRVRKLPESNPKATRKLPESYPKATRKLRSASPVHHIDCTIYRFHRVDCT